MTVQTDRKEGYEWLTDFLVQWYFINGLCVCFLLVTFTNDPLLGGRQAYPRSTQLQQTLDFFHLFFLTTISLSGGSMLTPSRLPPFPRISTFLRLPLGHTRFCPTGLTYLTISLVFYPAWQSFLPTEPASCPFIFSYIFCSFLYDGCSCP